ncbi:hypothetical protein [Kineobactrum sediminis]|nr:hypothetical protein [Kineobactrum sediminis]
MIYRLTRIAAITTAAVLIGGCAGNSAGNTVAQNAAADTETGLVCKTVQKTGTRIGTRVCQNPEQAEQDAQGSRDAVNAIQRNSVQGAGPQGG